jgi:hypothetical protein
MLYNFLWDDVGRKQPPGVKAGAGGTKPSGQRQQLSHDDVELAESPTSATATLIRPATIYQAHGLRRSGSGSGGRPTPTTTTPAAFRFPFDGGRDTPERLGSPRPLGSSEVGSARLTL